MNGTTSYFSVGDWVVIFAYLAGIILLGVWFGKDQRNVRDYFLGSKNIPWWGIGLSIVAAETSALTIIGVPAIAYGGNIAFIQMIIGYVIARLILAVVMVPHYLKGEIYSPYQLFADRLGASARQTAGGLFLISETLAAGVRVYVVSIPIQLMLGIGVVPAIILFVVLSLVYTYVGGVKAVIWTDAVQFGLFLLGGLYALWYIPTLVDGGFAGLMKTAASADKLHWFNGQFSFAEPYNIWMGVIGGTVVVMSSHGAEQLIVQRVLACKTVADGRKALVLSAVLIFPLFVIFLLVGVMLWVFYQSHPFQIPLPEARPGIKANDFIFPIFMMTEVPHILRGFLIVAILSAAMSSVSSALTSLSSVSTMDFIKGKHGKRSEEYYLNFSKYSTVAWAAILIVVAYLSREVAFVMDAAFTLRGLTSGALLGGLMLAIFWKNARTVSVVAGMLASLVFMIGLSQFSWAVTVGEKTVQQKVFWPWFTLIGTTVTLAVAWITSKFIANRSPAELAVSQAAEFAKLLNGGAPLLALAPMQDVTDGAFWNLMHHYGGADIYWTEYFRVHSVSRPEKWIVESIEQNATGRPVIAQMIGNDIPALLRTVRELQQLPIAAIDLNLGCPAPIVYKKCAGGGLLREPQRIDSILGALRENVSVKFTVKTRVGFASPAEFDTLLPIFAKHSIDLLTVHARTVAQMYRLPVHYDLIRQASEALPCPVIANGHVYSADQALDVLAQTKARGLMIGRGVIRSPWLFGQIRQRLRNEPVTYPTGREVLAYIEALWASQASFDAPEKIQAERMKKFMNYLGEGVAPDFLQRIRRTISRSEFFQICREFMDHDQPMKLEPTP